MTEARFIQFHWLTSYPGTLLNRDDAGIAKTLPFGGALRTRISSQCLKRTWRKAKDANNIGLIEEIGTAERSREHVERLIIKGLAEETGKPAELVTAVGLAFIEALYGEKGKDRKSRQALLLGWPEIGYMRKEALRLVGESEDTEHAKVLCAEYFGKDGIRRVFRAVRAQSAAPGGFEAALFGRMITSDPEANIDAALHVAHAITVHRAEKELDFLTVVDDLRGPGDEAGAAGVFDMELTSGTLANAFRKPVELRGDLYAESIKALKAHVSGLDLAYGPHEVRSGFCICDSSASIEAMGGTAKSLPELSDWLRHTIANGRA
jgi:CRISPR system Cascade subunit CasC